MLRTFSCNNWNEPILHHEQSDAIKHLEEGHVLYLPHLPFTLTDAEQLFLSPDFADPHAKNISYQANCHKLWGMQGLTDGQHEKLKNMMDRFCQYALSLTSTLLSHYAEQLIVGRTSYRPVEISNRKTSFRKDDKRLHIDAFPSAPNQGKRILRVFSNINPNGQDRVWRIGESFTEVASHFLPKCPKPHQSHAALLRLLRITKSYRTPYDHYMLHIHDRMKADEAYQDKAKQQEIRFPPGSTWIIQTDDVSHAAMQGQYVLEQTFYLPIHAMKDESKAPLRILEKILKRRLA